MKADSYTISEVFSAGGKIHYVLPHFQREYRWERKNWEVLLEDAFQLLDALTTTDNVKAEHFLGALVVLPDGNIGLGIPVHRLVDGQQRLTTISLLLSAFSQLIEASEPELVAEIRSYLFNNTKGDGRFKLLPTLKHGDRAAYAAVLERGPVPHSESRIPQAFDFFKKALEKRAAAEQLDAHLFFQVLTQIMQVVCIRLNADENAYQIFESLNNKAEPLKQSDLVRNYIAMRLSSDKQERVFQEHWAPIEMLLDDNRMVGRSNMGELTALLRHYDAMRAGALPSEKHIYARFRDEMKLVTTEDALVQELATLRCFATYYDNLLRPDKGARSELRRALLRLEALDITTAYPFLLALADRFDKGEIEMSDYVEGCALLENYLVRRFLVDAPTHFLNKMFAALAKALDWSNFLPSLRAALAERQYPSDTRVRQVFPGRSLYDKNNTRDKIVLLFETINRHLYRNSDVVPVLNGIPTLEHILPQTLSPWWKNELGDDADALAREWKHTVGNLTLVTQSYNSSLSNDSFPEKKIKLTAHGLRLNSDYFSRPIEHWDADAIQARAEWLTEKVLEIWPSLAPEAERTAPLVTATPTALIVRGEVFKTESWRDVLRQSGEFAVRNGADFNKLSDGFTVFLSPAPFQRGNHTLSNGWHLNLHLNAKDSFRHCVRLLTTFGLSRDEWHIEES